MMIPYVIFKAGFLSLALLLSLVHARITVGISKKSNFHGCNSFFFAKIRDWTELSHRLRSLEATFTTIYDDAGRKLTVILNEIATSDLALSNDSILSNEIDSPVIDPVPLMGKNSGSSFKAHRIRWDSNLLKKMAKKILLRKEPGNFTHTHNEDGAHGTLRLNYWKNLITRANRFKKSGIVQAVKSLIPTFPLLSMTQQKILRKELGVFADALLDLGNKGYNYSKELANFEWKMHQDREFQRLSGCLASHEFQDSATAMSHRLFIEHVGGILESALAKYDALWILQQHFSRFGRSSATFVQATQQCDLALLTRLARESFAKVHDVPQSATVAEEIDIGAKSPKTSRQSFLFNLMERRVAGILLGAATDDCLGRFGALPAFRQDDDRFRKVAWFNTIALKRGAVAVHYQRLVSW